MEKSEEKGRTYDGIYLFAEKAFQFTVYKAAENQFLCGAYRKYAVSEFVYELP